MQGQQVNFLKSSNNVLLQGCFVIQKKLPFKSMKKMFSILFIGLILVGGGCESFEKSFPIIDEPYEPFEGHYDVCADPSSGETIYKFSFYGDDSGWERYYDKNGDLIEATPEIGPYTGLKAETQVENCVRTTDDYFQSITIKENSNMDNFITESSFAATSMFQIWAFLIVPLLIIFVLWSIFWKGLGLWHSAKAKQPYWFVAMLVINTAGILEIIYLFGVLKLKFSELFGKK